MCLWSYGREDFGQAWDLIVSWTSGAGSIYRAEIGV